MNGCRLLSHSCTRSHTRKQTYLHSIAVVHEANLVTAVSQIHVATIVAEKANPKFAFSAATLSSKKLFKKHTHNSFAAAGSERILLAADIKKTK